MDGASTIGAKSIGQLSVEALERRLGVRRQARLDAAVETPPSHSAEPAPMEIEISRAVAAARARLDAERRAAAGAAERAARKAQAAAQTGAEHELAEAQLALRLSEGRFRAEMAAARARAERATADLEGFRRTHDLRRPAVYPGSMLLSAALLILAAGLEALFSAALFDADVEGGLLAAAAVAGGLGGANVALGFLGGFLGLRYTQHRALSMRVAGVGAFLIAFGLAANLNLYAGKWRDQIHAEAGLQETHAANLDAQADLERCLADIRNNADAASDDAVYSAKEARCRARHAPSPTAPPQAGLWLVGLATPEAVVLLMLAAGVWAFAALKGFSGVDDPYPDYGKMDRAAKRAQAEADAVRADARESLEETIEAVRDALDDARAARREALKDAEAALDAAADALDPLKAEDRRLARAEGALLGIYREENARRRATPAPQSFQAPPESPAERDDLAAAGEALDAARSAHAAADAALASGLSALASAVEEALARLDPPTAPGARG